MVAAPAVLASARLEKSFPLMFMNKLLKSILPNSKPIGGIMISLTRDVTIFPNAAPIIMPVAISTILPFAIKALNSFIII